MTHATKIATCCYCSSRTMLKPSARDGHELACGSCGAALHNMKWLKAPKPDPTPIPTPKASPKPKTKSKPTKRSAFTSSLFASMKFNKKKKKRRKPLWKRGLEEAWDVIEDIFD